MKKLLICMCIVLLSSGLKSYSSEYGYGNQPYTPEYAGYSTKGNTTPSTYNKVKYPAVRRKCIHSTFNSYDNPFEETSGYDSNIRRLSGIFDLAEKYYDTGNYQLAKREIDKLIPYYPNSTEISILKSQIEDMLGNNTTAMEYANNALRFYQYDELYTWRAYLMIKSGDISKTDAILSDLSKCSVYGHYHLFAYGTEIIWTLMEDKNIPSTLKADVYKSFITTKYGQRGQKIIVPIIASYIQFIYSLDDSDPLFKKLGKTKNQILTAYLATLQDKDAPVIKGIMKFASGNTRAGKKEIISAIELAYDSFGKDFFQNNILDVVGNSLRMLKPMPRKVDSYGIGIKIKLVKNENESLFDNWYSVIITEILNPDLISKGLRVGDKITKINGKNINSIGDINDIEEYMSGEKDSIIKIEAPHIPGELVLNRTYHIQDQVYDYFVLPLLIKRKSGGYIFIGPDSHRAPGGMYIYDESDVKTNYYQYTM